MIEITDKERTIELTKIIGAKLINVDVINSNDEVDYHYVITEDEMLKLLKNFERTNNIS